MAGAAPAASGAARGRRLLVGFLLLSVSSDPVVGASASPEFWPWLALAGLGAFHGLNPAMGWLFAVALGLHRQERRIVWLALVPIALGHAASVAAVALLFLWAGWLVDGRAVRVGAALVLIGWALYHWRFGHRHRVRFGMQVGLAGLFAWSFLMAAAHGAGLMLWPALMPLCLPGGAGAVAASSRWRPGSPVSASIRWRCCLSRRRSPPRFTSGSDWGPAQGLAEHRRALGSGPFGDGHADAVKERHLRGSSGHQAASPCFFSPRLESGGFLLHCESKSERR